MPRKAESPPDLTTQAGRLRWARIDSGYESARSAANDKGWNENTYKSHEGGIRQAEGLKEKHLRKYARGFNVSLQWLAFGQGSPKANVTPPTDPDDPADLLRKALKAIEGG